ncbi:MAG: 1-deoxy-D-xylulose-5-phosphate reductoisomerase [Planctomycetes bacterium]|nr:1-deoxy-D-xylulose-5-phosphate reductoisomerase [Planctomycetota bacterium]MCB9904015.1 1-deoxy-D-xylulose-5-phosphate reductoisomerase [Planctomycetota bacterium]
MKSLLLIGSTGSIGTQTLDVVRQSPGAFRVLGLGARSSWRMLLDQVREFLPPFVGMVNEAAADELERELPAGTTLFRGPDAMERLARELDYHTCVHGVVGAAGVRPSLAVLERGLTLALANKESLVVAGDLLMAIARERGGEIIPVDSEHSAIHQCLRGERLDRVRRILLTASGGPFRKKSAAELESVTPAEALRHPNWEMGPRITVGSATLMNKALEVIEVHHLFGLERERIQVVIHPQSIVHSMVEFVDGSVIAQLGPPDMRLPIHYALFAPDRASAPWRGFDIDLFRCLEFESPDLARFPALELGFRCVEEGSDSGSVLNAADEVTVQAFLDGRIAFPDIHRINRAVLDKRSGHDASLDDLLGADQRARELAREDIAALARA